MTDTTEQHLERIKAAAKGVSIAVDSLRAADRANVAARSRHAIAVAMLHDAITNDQPEPDDVPDDAPDDVKPDAGESQPDETEGKP